MLAERRDQRVPGKQPLGDAPVIGIRLAVAPAVEGEAAVRFLDREDHVAVGLDVVVGLAAAVHRIVVDLEAVDIGHVAGVDAAFHGLEIVALLQALGDEHVARRQGAPLDLRRRRHLVARPHIGPHDAGPLDAGIGLDAHVLAKVRRRGDVDAFAGAREFQAVIGAADAVLLVAAEVERDPAVRAELVDRGRPRRRCRGRRGAFRRESARAAAGRPVPRFPATAGPAPSSGAAGFPSACRGRCAPGSRPCAFPCVARSSNWSARTHNITILGPNLASKR